MSDDYNQAELWKDSAEEGWRRDGKDKAGLRGSPFSY